MKTFKLKAMFVSLVIMLAFLQTVAAMAADPKNAAELKPTYKKVTGQVVSASPTSIVVKGRAKGPLTLAVTDKTDMIGAKAAKAGDKAAVNYRVDKSGKTATRIEVLSVSAKSAAPAPATASSKPN